MIYIAIILSLLSSPLFAGENNSFIRPLPSQPLVQAIEGQLDDITTSWNELNERERMAHAVATLARLSDFQTRIGLSNETLQQIKIGEIEVSPELRLKISRLAQQEFLNQLSNYRNQLDQTRPGRRVGLKVGIEFMKGIAAMNVAMLSAWLATSGVPIEPADLVVGVKVLGFLAAVYAAMRPFEIVNLLSQHGEHELKRVTKLANLVAKSPIPTELSQSWLLLQQFADEQIARDCDRMLRER